VELLFLFTSAPFVIIYIPLHSGYIPAIFQLFRGIYIFHAEIYVFARAVIFSFIFYLQNMIPKCAPRIYVEYSSEYS
jgi:hypothetical protein